jgi:hypothetical protein
MAHLQTGSGCAVKPPEAATRSGTNMDHTLYIVPRVQCRDICCSRRLSDIECHFNQAIIQQKATDRCACVDTVGRLRSLPREAPTSLNRARRRLCPAVLPRQLAQTMHVSSPGTHPCMRNVGAGACGTGHVQWRREEWKGSSYIKLIDAVTPVRTLNCY